MPSISAIHSVNSGLCATFGMLFNIFLIWLIMRRSVPALRLYRCILLQTCVIDIYTICLMVAVQPVYIVVSGWNVLYQNGPVRLLPLPYSVAINLLWYFGFYFSITSNALQYLYRYLVLCRNTEITPMRYFFMLSATAVPVIFYLFMLCIICYPEQTQPIAQLNSEIFSNIHENVTITMLANSDSNSWRFLHLLYVVPYDIGCYIVIIACGIKIRRFVREKQMCSQAMKHNQQISIILVLQAILPCLGAIVGSVQVLATIALSSASAIYSTAFATLVINWVPVLNPLITILVIKSYRRVVFRRTI
ncbi:serpentine type 7TM GPCR chemoreceptor srd domain-containing protein [Ditylenchus destructor]|uniref:Serpentine type 7TM GPCR chemoreceptor srd domain-containing protein n=1 Tax=Ditylenchus destructor TaxID=166010 RepID=A0AAD4MSQ1_9BILA|nr:serpentine type 7TM GPCR chemoreceptor srd domain-containing protein [Ditylenchus destructor]